jgi:hypothetical protein
VKIRVISGCYFCYFYERIRSKIKVRIDQHISTLLFEHDCVIIPEFGGFVTSYAPTKIHFTQHVFSPPRKSISFNKHLKSNDGLLANQIVQSDGKSFPEAFSIINSFVVECNAAFKRGDKIAIAEVGTLFLDVERNIQFEPDNSVNYLVEAFGMTSVQSLPIKRSTITEKIEKQFIDREPIPQERKRSKRVAYVATSIVLFLATTLVFLSLQPNLLKSINYSSLNPFSDRMKTLYVKRTESKLTLTENNFNKSVFPITVNDTVALTTISFVNDIENKLVVHINENVPVIKPKRDKTLVASDRIKSTYGLKYHVVSGCFKIESNARNFIAMLKSKNLPAAIIGKNKDGLFIVSCGDFARKEDAYSELARLRSGNTQAWMLEQ